MDHQPGLARLAVHFLAICYPPFSLLVLTLVAPFRSSTSSFLYVIIRRPEFNLYHPKMEERSRGVAQWTLRGSETSACT